MPVTYYAYADESGIQGGDNPARFVVVAGYLGTAQQWENCEGTWRAILKRHDVERFHARKFFRRKMDSKTETVLFLLTELLINLGVTPIAAGFSIDDFNRLTLRQRQWFTGGNLVGSSPHYKWRSTGAPSKPYYAALMHVLWQAAAAVEEDGQIHFCMDRQNVMER